MCIDSDIPISVEPIVTKKYKRTCLTKNKQEEPVGIGGWPPISTSVIEWSDKCEEKFQFLKYLLTDASILKVSDLDEDFFVCTNACKERLGGVLMQNGHVICYKSIKLKEHEKNYSSHDSKIEFIIHALIMSMHYIMGIKFELRKDHSGLKCFFE
jgi:hypothetical protein